MHIVISRPDRALKSARPMAVNAGPGQMGNGRTKHSLPSSASGLAEMRPALAVVKARIHSNVRPLAFHGQRSPCADRRPFSRLAWQPLTNGDLFLQRCKFDSETVDG